MLLPIPSQVRCGSETQTDLSPPIPSQAIHFEIVFSNWKPSRIGPCLQIAVVDYCLPLSSSPSRNVVVTLTLTTNLISCTPSISFLGLNLNIEVDFLIERIREPHMSGSNRKLVCPVHYTHTLHATYSHPTPFCSHASPGQTWRQVL